MEFRIADTFTSSLVRLTGDEQKAVKTTAFDLQLNPAQPSLSFHKLDRTKDKNFWSVRVSRDVRIIVHRSSASLLLCYVGHHDNAYAWAERRKLETHPKTGAAQLVEIRERVEEIVVSEQVPAFELPERQPLIFDGILDDELLSYGVPEEWLSDVRQATEDSLMVLTDHLPSEASEALLELATGGTPKVRPLVSGQADSFEHPDAQRRFRVLNNVEELERALSFPWDKWTIFLHPEQRNWVERAFNGPARVSGSAGTGKTIVAVHRAVHLAKKNPDSRVLLATFSEPLANSLKTKVRRLIAGEPRLAERLEVHSMDAIGLRLFEALNGKAKLATQTDIDDALREAFAGHEGLKFGRSFVLGEWNEIVDAWQLGCWDEYRDVRRLGRKTRLPEARRLQLWPIFQRMQEILHDRRLLTKAGLFAKLTHSLAGRGHSPFDYAVIDESQDVSIAQLRFLSALGSSRPDSLFFAGDLGQRIFQQPFSWLSLGVDIRGRSKTLNVNYRTSHQIRTQADRLLDRMTSDSDGNEEDRGHTVSTFNGNDPVIRTFESESEESQFVAGWVIDQLAQGTRAEEMAMIVRSSAEVSRATDTLELAGVDYAVLDENLGIRTGAVSVCTMHLAKGLEFRSVAVMACDDEVVPLQVRIESITDDSDLEEIYNTERHLLYVACTRARDTLLLTCKAPASEFLDDLIVS